MTTVKVLKAPGGAGGRITAAWTLSPGVDLVRAEVATKPGRDSFGMFHLLNQVDWGDFDGPRRSWTSRLLKPGTYYFHVGAEDHEAADPDPQWSKTRRVKVPGTPVRGGRYVGKTSQGHQIRILTDRLRTLIKELTVTVRVRCSGVTRKTSVSAGDTVAIRSSGTFSGTIRQPGQPSFLPAGSVTGRFDPATKVVGAIRLDYGGTGGTEQCVNGAVRFSARRVA